MTNAAHARLVRCLARNVNDADGPMNGCTGPTSGHRGPAGGRSDPTGNAVTIRSDGGKRRRDAMNQQGYASGECYDPTGVRYG